MKPYDLVGIDGNAFAIMGYVSSAMRRTGYSNQDRSEYIKSATSGDYTNLVSVSMEMVDKINDRLRNEGKLEDTDDYDLRW